MRAEHIDAFIRASSEALEILDPCPAELGPLAIRAELRPRRQISLVVEVTGSVSGLIIYGLSLATAQKIALAVQDKPAMNFDHAAANALTQRVNAVATRAAAAMRERGSACEPTPATLFRLGDDPSDSHPGPAA